MKERGNEVKLRKASAFMQRDYEMLLEILEIEEGEESDNLYMAMHYQFMGKLHARYLDKEAAIKYYEISENIFKRANNGQYSLLMQSFFQFYIDDLTELQLEEKA